MKKKPQVGTIVIILNTDLERSEPLNENELSPLQKICLAKLSKDEQDRIRAGNGAFVVDLESGERVCEFNMENYHPPKSAIESLAQSLLPTIEEFYSQEDNRRLFDEWKNDNPK